LSFSKNNSKDRIVSQSYSLKISQIEEISAVAKYKGLKSDSELMREAWEAYKALNSDLLNNAMKKRSKL